MACFRVKQRRVEFLTAKVPSLGNHEFSGDPWTCQQGRLSF
jgi:hypothetical protein